MTEWHTWTRPIYEQARQLGFCPRDTEFVEVSADSLYQAAAYGLPGMYPHWSFGRDYWRLKSQFESGFTRIYEMVTNTRPSLAYLLAENTPAENLYVIAHVAGHAEYFDRHMWMRSVDHDISRSLHAAAERFQEYAFEYGADRVEALIDLGNALSPHVTQEVKPPAIPVRPSAGRPSEFSDLLAGGLDPSQLEEAWARRKARATAGLPCFDPLYYLIAQAPLEPWQQDVLTVVRHVALHQRPQRFTKVADEGWACFVGLKILRTMDLPGDVHWPQAELHAAIAHGGEVQLNPYWLGWRLWEHLEAEGRDVRALCEVETDSSFLRNWIDEAFVHKERLYVWAADDRPGPGGTYDLKVTSRNWEDVRDKIAAEFSPNVPQVHVVDKESDGCLVLETDGRLQKEDATSIMRAIADIWKGKIALSWRDTATGQESRWEVSGGGEK